MWEVWGPAILSSGVVGLAGTVTGWFAKSAIEQHLKSSFDQKLEVVKADIRAKEAKIDAVRTAILRGLGSQSESLNKRKMEACERLWAATLFQRKYSMAHMFVQTVKLSEIFRVLGLGGGEAEKIKQFTNLFTGSIDFEDLAKDERAEVAKERPFLPQKAWLAYRAISSLSARAGFILIAIKTGVQAVDFMKGPEEVNQLILEVLPEQKAFLDSLPDVGGYYLITQLEEAIFKELETSLGGTVSDEEMLSRVSGIMMKIDQARLTIDKPEIPAVLRRDPPDLKAG